jgi:8-oxo-dGTP diphosphatase
MLQGKRNQYGGLFIDGEELPVKIDDFKVALSVALDAWTREDLKLVWLEISAHRGELLPEALSLGFSLHHCRQQNLMLVKRLQTDAYIPDACTHSVGAGGLVVSEDGRILVVLEQCDSVSRPQHFKLPGGMLERGEHLADGVIREVFEETGIRTDFGGLLGIRHHHRGQFGASNIYAVCRLIPLNFNIRLDESELSKALWLPGYEYLVLDGIGAFNRRAVQAALSAEALTPIKLDNYMGGPDEYEIFMTDAPHLDSEAN